MLADIKLGSIYLFSEIERIFEQGFKIIRAGEQSVGKHVVTYESFSNEAETYTFVLNEVNGLEMWYAFISCGSAVGVIKPKVKPANKLTFLGYDWTILGYICENPCFRLVKDKFDVEISYSSELKAYHVSINEVEGTISYSNPLIAMQHILKLIA